MVNLFIKIIIYVLIGALLGIPGGDVPLSSPNPNPI